MEESRTNKELDKKPKIFAEKNKFDMVKQVNTNHLLKLAILAMRIVLVLVALIITSYLFNIAEIILFNDINPITFAFIRGCVVTGISVHIWDESRIY